MPNPFKNPFKTLQHLSIDVVAGSMSMGVLAVKLLHAEVPVIWWVILPVTVWVMYTLDHLLDAARLHTIPTIQRHLFHRQHANQLVYWTIGLGITALALTITFLPVQIIFAGAMLSAIILLYFISLRFLPERTKKWIPKEMVIACIYVGGIFFVPWFFSAGTIPWEAQWLIPLTILLVWSEGVMAAWYDMENDLHDGHHSFATLAGKSLTRKIVTGVLTITLAGLILTMIRDTTFEILASCIVLATINSGLLIITRADTYFSKNFRYRGWGEILFILPVVLLWF